MAGYRSFLDGRLSTEQTRYRELAEHGQSPEVMVVGCCDSRVSPEVIFDARPGELFVVRNVANLIPPYAPDGAYHGVSAALEFGWGSCGSHIVVLVMRNAVVCAFVEDNEPVSPGDFIGRWMSLIAPAAERIGPRGDLARGVCHPVGTGLDRPQPRQSADVSAIEKADRARRRHAPRRLLRRRHRSVVGAGSVSGAFVPVAAEDHARVGAAAVLTSSHGTTLLGT